MNALRYTTHLGYAPPALRPQFHATLGANLTAHVHYAAELGMAGVLYPWAIDRTPMEREAVRLALAETGLLCSAVAALPLELTISPVWTDRSRQSRTKLANTIAAASDLAVSLTSTILTVIVSADSTRESLTGQQDDLVSNLRDVAPIAEDHGLTLGIEPMLRMPHPLLRSTAVTAEVIAMTGRPNVGLVFDTTHVSMMDGDVMAILADHYDDIVALQLSDEPGRVEPGAGKLPLVEVATEAIRRGYRGLVDLEHGWLDQTRNGEQVGLERIRSFDSQVAQRLSAR